MKANTKYVASEWHDTRSVCLELGMSRQAWHQWVTKLGIVPKRVHDRRFLWRTSDVSRVVSERRPNA